MKSKRLKSKSTLNVIIGNKMMFLAVWITACANLTAQDLEVNGIVKISGMIPDSGSTSLVVRDADSILAIREINTSDCPAIDPNVTNSGAFSIGKDTLGGIVFEVYIGSDGQQHGFIVSKIETLAKYHNFTTSHTHGSGRSWDGAFNTAQMSNSPAKNWITSNFSSEWYLPAIDELNLLYDNRFHINKVLHEGGNTLLSSIADYFSSTEQGGSLAYVIKFFTGENNNNTGKSQTKRVRAIRAF